MTNNKVKHIEYEISDRGKGLYVLQYLDGVLAEEGAALEVSKAVFDYAMENSVSLRELFDQFELHNNKVLYKIGKPISNYGVSGKTSDNQGNETHHGAGYFVTNENDKYYLNYQLARHGGGTGRFEISKEIFLYAKREGVSTRDIFDKFDLAHLDVEENYIKS